MLRDAEEEVEGKLGAVVEHGDAARAVEGGDPPARDELDVTLDERGNERLGRVGRRRHRRPEGDDEGDLAPVPDTALGQVVVQEQGGLARRRRALERRSADADDRLAARERGQHLGHPLRAGDRVELVARLGEPGRRVEVVVGAERDDEDVGLVDPRIGRDPARLGIDRGDRLLQEADAGLGDVSVRKANGVQSRPPEHHVELRVAEDESVALVDQGDGDLVADRLREHRRELEPAEAGSQDDDSLHRTILGEGSRCQSHMPL